MSERIEEAKGSIKQGVGHAAGDPELEAEGKAQKDSAKAAREVKGMGNQIKGAVEEGVGKLTGNEETRARGVADRLKGDAERAG